MEDLFQVVDWSRWQFALTAIVHWLFVPLTIGLSLIVGIMETIYYRTGDERWLKITKFWMTLFGINFACGVATGIILEFEFGTNWSNYSWFVGDIFGAPLAIEGIFAFFLESTFIAVMFFGWKKVSRGFHLAATWLTAIGVVLSALWILVANAWMQYPAGMEFDPAQMRNVMVSFTDVALSPVAVNKFFHTVFSGWVLGAGFVVGVSCYYLWRRRMPELAIPSIKIAGWVGLAGILLTMYTGDGSAVQVARHQPMKLAAMEGLYNGKVGADLVAVGFVDTEAGERGEESVKHSIMIPKGLSILANHDSNTFVSGINNLIDGYELNAQGDTIRTVSYAERIERGRSAREALGRYDAARRTGDNAAMELALSDLQRDYEFFGYGYLDSPRDAVPPVSLTFYMFRIMVAGGGYLLLFFAVFLWMAYSRERALTTPLASIVGMATIAVVWIVSEAGWVVAEVGRQPWVIQDLMPTRAAISDIDAGSVQLTFWLFAAVFTCLLIAEVSIMTRYIARRKQL